MDDVTISNWPVHTRHIGGHVHKIDKIILKYTMIEAKSRKIEMRYRSGHPSSVIVLELVQSGKGNAHRSCINWIHLAILFNTAVL